MLLLQSWAVELLTLLLLNKLNQKHLLLAVRTALTGLMANHRRKHNTCRAELEAVLVVFSISVQ